MKIENTLLAAFTPIVRDQCQMLVEQIMDGRRQSVHFSPTNDTVGVEFTVTYGRELQPGDVLYHFNVKPTGHWFVDELCELGKGLVDFFSVHEKGPFPVNGPHTFDIGDGDDTQAIDYKNGVFRIWTRGWSKHHTKK